MGVLTSVGRLGSRLRIAIVLLCIILVVLALATGPDVGPRFRQNILSSQKGPRIGQMEKVMVMGTNNAEEKRWWEAEDIAKDFHTFVYWMGGKHENPGFLDPVTARGREAAAYLSYIVANYDDLPKYSLFLHAGDDQWHNDVSGHLTSDMLPLIRYEAVDAHGYVNLRCISSPGCQVDIHPLDVDDHARETNDARARFADIYQFLFNKTKEEVPDAIGNVCCAQFAVAREQIRMRPKEGYEKMLWWLETYVDNDFNKGWIFEKLWHVIFGKDNIYCPSAERCRCDVYGWCGPLSNGDMLTPIGAKTDRVAWTG